MKSGRLFWGIVLAAAGVILLLQNFNLISGQFWPIFFALVIILIGVWILFRPVLLKNEYKTESLAIPLENTTEAEIVLKHGAGRITVDSLQKPGELISGTFSGGLEKKFNPGPLARLELSPAADGMWVFPFAGPNSGFIWNFGINRDIPIRLKVEAGAGENVLNLTDLLVKDLRISTGASSTDITLPSRAGYTQVSIEAGAASVKVRVPQGVAANIHLETGLAGNHVDTSRFPAIGDHDYRSADYENAANRVDIRIEAGVSSIDIL